MRIIDLPANSEALAADSRSHGRAATSSAETSGALASALGRRPAQAAIPASPLVRRQTGSRWSLRREGPHYLAENRSGRDRGRGVLRCVSIGRLSQTRDDGARESGGVVTVKARNAAGRAAV